MTDRISEIRARVETFSGLQYVVTRSQLQWPWTSAPATNQVVDLVREIPGLLDALAASQATVERLAAALRGVGVVLLGGKLCWCPEDHEMRRGISLSATKPAPRSTAHQWRAAVSDTHCIRRCTPCQADMAELSSELAASQATVELLTAALGPLVEFVEAVTAIDVHYASGHPNMTPEMERAWPGVCERAQEAVAALDGAPVEAEGG